MIEFSLLVPTDYASAKVASRYISLLRMSHDSPCDSQCVDTTIALFEVMKTSLTWPLRMSNPVMESSKNDLGVVFHAVIQFIDICR